MEMNRGTNSFHEPFHVDLVTASALGSRLALISILAAQRLVEWVVGQFAAESSRCGRPLIRGSAPPALPLLRFDEILQR